MAQETEREIIRVHDFLFGLDEVHGSVRSQICAYIPLPDLDKVHQSIMQNETVQLNAKTETPTVLSFAAQQNTSDHTRKNSQSNSTSRQYDNSRPRNINPDVNVTFTSCGRA